MTRRRLFSTVLVIAALGITAADAAPRARADLPIIAGPATVIDGDTLAMGGERVRLWGSDAPEARQTCTRRGREWACGVTARTALARLIAGHRLVCRPLYRDRDGRPVARCDAAARDLSTAMVTAGWAFDYPDFSNRAFQGQERQARARRVGIWQGEVIPPWIWRARQRRAEGASGDRGCRIKGNINARGQRIAHMPGQRDYAVVTIDPARGERWFCSPAAARAAGWRLARR